MDVLPSNQNQFENRYKIVEIPRPKPVKSFGKYPNTIQAHPTDVLKEISRTKSQEKTLDDLRNELRNIFNSKFKNFVRFFWIWLVENMKKEQRFGNGKHVRNICSNEVPRRQNKEPGDSESEFLTIPCENGLLPYMDKSST